ncbi:MAG: hypothetical protein BAJALOKI2v1_70003 [Promethearchaeota archaeon]|nr:MAG: hypothetical protein BAJALOKI2v1_70003 [Candidatus Lokiarchaeota archaeon]
MKFRSSENYYNHQTDNKTKIYLRRKLLMIIVSTFKIEGMVFKNKFGFF